jgi:hypothetical protein
MVKATPIVESNVTYSGRRHILIWTLLLIVMRWELARPTRIFDCKFRPRSSLRSGYSTRRSASNADRPKLLSALPAALLLAGSVALTLALSHLAYHYLRLSEGYARLILN